MPGETSAWPPSLSFGHVPRGSRTPRLCKCHLSCLRRDVTLHTAAGVFHDEVHGRLGLNDLVQLDDVGVVKHLHHSYFSAKLYCSVNVSNDTIIGSAHLFQRGLGHVSFVDNFHRHLHVRQRVAPQLDLSKVALANRLMQAASVHTSHRASLMNLAQPVVADLDALRLCFDGGRCVRIIL